MCARARPSGFLPVVIIISSYEEKKTPSESETGKQKKKKQKRALCAITVQCVQLWFFTCLHVRRALRGGFYTLGPRPRCSARVYRVFQRARESKTFLYTRRFFRNFFANNPVYRVHALRFIRKRYLLCIVNPRDNLNSNSTTRWKTIIFNSGQIFDRTDWTYILPAS